MKKKKDIKIGNDFEDILNFSKYLFVRKRSIYPISLKRKYFKEMIIIYLERKKIIKHS